METLTLLNPFVPPSGVAHLTREQGFFRNEGSAVIPECLLLLALHFKRKSPVAAMLGQSRLGSRVPWTSSLVYSASKQNMCQFMLASD